MFHRTFITMTANKSHHQDDFFIRPHGGNTTTIPLSPIESEVSVPRAYTPIMTLRRFT
jgi:hypothetical protein